MTTALLFLTVTNFLFLVGLAVEIYFILPGRLRKSMIIELDRASRDITSEIRVYLTKSEDRQG